MEQIDGRVGVVMPHRVMFRGASEGKKRLAIRYLSEGKSRAEVAMLVGCTDLTLAEWMKKYLENGLTGRLSPHISGRATLWIDRDSELVAHLFDERNNAVKQMISKAIQTVHKHDRKIGICGQAPSDYPEFAKFLVNEGIDSMSLNPDSVLKTRMEVVTAERAIS